MFQTLIILVAFMEEWQSTVLKFVMKWEVIGKKLFQEKTLSFFLMNLIADVFCLFLSLCLPVDIVIGVDLILNQKIQKHYFFQDIQNSFK